MENLHDYSDYITLAYSLTVLVLTALMLVTLAKYFVSKSKNKNEKSA